MTNTKLTLKPNPYNPLGKTTGRSKIDLNEVENAFGDKHLALFFFAWLDSGLNATEAYIKLNPHVKYSSARVLGHRNLAQLTNVNIAMVLSYLGMGVDKYFEMLQDGLDADIWNGQDMVPDQSIRIKYHTKLGRILGIEKTPSGINNIQQVNLLGKSAN